ncbi:MAG: ATP-grasp domain-containing protein [Candidatus Gracilibacteria bacterium]|jgi:predicted ATP-grasp superfamily ATP-dependent carboligase
MTLPKIAASINNIDPIFLDQYNKNNLYVVVFENSSLYKFTLKNFQKDKIITIKNLKNKDLVNLDFLETTEMTDLAKRLKESGVEYFVLPHKNLQKIEEWSKKNKIKMTAPSSILQENLEDKLFFDEILKKYKLSSPKTFTKNSLPKDKSYVLQKAKSIASLGTTFHKNPKTLLETLSKMSETEQKNYLIREYLNGVPVGISIFLDKDGNYFFSGMRRQCFDYKGIFPHIFLGIQWLRKDFFPKPAMKKIYLLMESLAKTLLKQNFIGIANIDVVIYKNIPYIIECNPRMSSATQHVFSVPNMCNIKNPWEFFLNTFCGNKNIKVKANKTPKTNFEGCLLDVDVMQKTKITHVPEIGTYSLENNKVKFISGDLKDFTDDKKRFFIFHDLSDKKMEYENCTICTIVSNYPLFNVKTGKLNQKGKFLHDYFKKKMTT